MGRSRPWSFLEEVAERIPEAWLQPRSNGSSVTTARLGLAGSRLTSTCVGFIKAVLAICFPINTPSASCHNRWTLRRMVNRHPGCGRRSIRHCSARQSVLSAKRRLCGAEGSKNCGRRVCGRNSFSCLCASPSGGVHAALGQLARVAFDDEGFVVSERLRVAGRNVSLNVPSSLQLNPGRGSRSAARVRATRRCGPASGPFRARR